MNPFELGIKAVDRKRPALVAADVGNGAGHPQRQLILQHGKKRCRAAANVNDAGRSTRWLSADRERDRARRLGHE